MTGYTDYSEPYLEAKALMRNIHDQLLAGKIEEAMRMNIQMINELIAMQALLARIA